MQDKESTGNELQKTNDDFQPSQVYSSIQDLIQACITRVGNSASLQQVYAVCQDIGYVVDCRKGGWRLIINSKHWKSQIRHTLYTSFRFQRCQEGGDLWRVAETYANAPQIASSTQSGGHNESSEGSIQPTSLQSGSSKCPNVFQNIRFGADPSLDDSNDTPPPHSSSSPALDEKNEDHVQDSPSLDIAHTGFACGRYTSTATTAAAANPVASFVPIHISTRTTRSGSRSGSSSQSPCQTHVTLNRTLTSVVVGGRNFTNAIGENSTNVITRSPNSPDDSASDSHNRTSRLHSPSLQPTYTWQESARKSRRRRCVTNDNYHVSHDDDGSMNHCVISHTQALSTGGASEKSNSRYPHEHQQPMDTTPDVSSSTLDLCMSHIQPNIST
eukprot:CAMPEP_0175083824 /NCGR_PEP_ID=MMETSP0052_2-20121109/27634_1 /TAXON_ID=51329 ORGANISM="Polytomella parva, Strain SAG 63-3" /NCGR_SAMPLE_ID=MMETSP0052_2 /ASSEMBLY_ACC=CAM_ASM_000194 /LENGTH=385 /DNA_ID=CAMNT_0016355391 /DNA_START=28 /DNA_END=1182 /DNA_ORIENTATION=-